MSTYVIGDVQGCYDPLMRLLDRINFNEHQDQLWLTGDLVNRGPKSLQVLKLIKNINAITVLGNHDIHLITAYDGCYRPHAKDTLEDILKSSEAEELINWLRQQPLLYESNSVGLVHAGILPQWTWEEAKQYAQEAESFLKNKEAWLDNIKNFYGNEPSLWHENLMGIDRLRLIFNAFTRIRICRENGQADFGFKGPIEQIPTGYFPWFAVPGRKTEGQKILFGHWSHLRGVTNHPNAIGLDTGCIWGDALTAYCLETGELHAVPGES